MNLATPAGVVSSLPLMARSLDALSTVILNQRTLDLLGEGHRANIADLARQFAADKDARFVGLGDMAQNRSDFIVDAVHPTIWKDSATADWALTATGLGTFDEVVPEVASQFIRLDEDPDHWAYLGLLLEIGSANNMVRAFWNNINGVRFSRSTLWPAARLGSVKAYLLAKGWEFRKRGTFDLDIEFETGSVSEVVPYSIHLLLQEIASSASLATFVTATA